VVDLLAEKYSSYSTYCYTGNNPIRCFDVDGRYFDDKNEKNAGRIERRANKRASKLERKADRKDKRWENSGDLRDRVAELRQSATYVNDMKNDADKEYRYAEVNSRAARNNNVNAPTAKEIGTNNNGDNVITMFVVCFASPIC